MKRNMLYQMGKAFVNGYSRLMLTVDIVYEAGLPTGPKIIAANHPTTVDPFLILKVAPEQTHILISETLFKIPLVGKYLRHSGHIPVITANRRAAFDAAVSLLKQGCTVAIFPEGALSPTIDSVYPAHTGTVRMALTASVPVVPVGIYLQDHHIFHTRTVIDGAEESARWYLHGPYAMTVGRTLYFDSDIENREAVRCQSRHLMAQVSMLAHRSKKRVIHRHAGTAGNILRDTGEIPMV
jgi:1-acyl-sn-glycerol-3-phosphate acyltransferase